MFITYSKNSANQIKTKRKQTVNLSKISSQLRTKLLITLL